MNHIRKWIIENSFYVFLLSMFSFGMFAYVSIASSNVPIMDYWRYANGLIEKSYNGGVTLLDLCSYNGVHKSPLQLLLFLINVKVFHWNTQISMYMGVILSCASLILIYKIIDESSTNKKSILVSKVTCTVIVFTMVPYEIITQEFAFSSALGIFVFIGLVYVVSNFLHTCSGEYDKSIWLICLYMFFVINIIGGAFSVGLAIAVLIVIIFEMIKRLVRKQPINAINFAVLIFGDILSLALYFHGIQIATGGSGVGIGLIALVKGFIKGAILLCGTSLMGEYAGTTSIYIIGIILFIIHVCMFLIYVVTRLYQKSYIPAILYFYYGIIYGMLFIGRTGDGVSYLMAPRYAKEAVFVFIADIVVINLILEHFKESRKKLRFMYAASIATAILFNVCILSADVREVHMAPYRKVYCDNLIQIMLNTDEYSDDEMYVFQADSPDQVRSGVEIMKKYNLGVFNTR